MRLGVREQELSNSLGEGWAVQVHSSLGSTMDAAREWCRNTSDAGAFLVLAGTQTAGRGRQGRKWVSPQGGFYGTYAFLTDNVSVDFSGFSLSAGLTVVQSLNLSPEVVKLKWPNDLVVSDGRKLGGILIEVLRTNERTGVLVGTGINLCDCGLDMEDTAVLKHITGREWSPLEVAANISNNLLEAFRKFVQHGFVCFREDWLARSALPGQRITIDIAGQLTTGMYAGVNDRGSLLVETESGVREVVTGHIGRINAADC